jgi:predicted chitinase
MTLGMILENGWPECDLSDTERLTIPGTALSLPIQKGQPHAILQAFFRDMNEFIEPANNARGYNDEGSWTENNSVYTSNHKGATAIDWNWSDHPVNFMAPDPRAGWNGSVLIKGDQTPAVRELLAWYEGMVFWGNDWSSFRDSMHFQVGYNTYGPQNFDRVHSFIQRKIRADGFSTYRRGGVPRGGGSAGNPSTPANPVPPLSGLTAAVLHRVAVVAYGVRNAQPVSFYEARIDPFRRMLRDMGANTIDRRAMAAAQLFCQPGDGKRFRGRGWIQLTGRAHAAGFSQWMFQRGRATTPTQFVDRPEEMETIENAAQVAVYYWTVSRPQLNALADARNLEGATKAINGGLNGLADRRRFYDLFLAVNADLLDPVTTPTDPWEALLMSSPVDSWSIYATPGEDPIPPINLLRAIDAKIHRDLTDEDALAGDPEAIRRVARTALGQGKVKTPGAVAHATRILNQIPPAFIDAANPGKQA